MTISPPGFTGSRLDRADHLRTDPDAVTALIARGRGLLLDLAGYDPVATDDGQLGWTSLAEAPDDSELALLGILDDRPRFVALDPAAGPARRHPALFALLDRLAPGEAATYAAARSLADWHARHRFCANCSAKTGLHRAGWGRRCPVCQAEHFPRVDPVVIMLAEHDGRVLIGRQPVFPPGRYSALAGFVEVGESLEEAVARELFEEAGVHAISVRYVASQPWPFPSQLMIACVADVANDTITLDRNELEDAMWVTREEVRAALAEEDGAKFLPPPAYAIARTLFERWLG